MITSNATQVSQAIQIEIDKIASPEALSRLTREVALTIAGEMRIRIHENGRDTNNSPIGQYSEKYMKTRKKNNRTDSRNVILSLTRKFEDDLTLGQDNPEPTKVQDGWGIGYKSPEHYDRARYLEEKYEKKIFSMSKNEIKSAEIIVRDFVNRKK